MKIATWNISAGINPNDYKGEYFDKEKETTPDDACLNAIAQLIIKENIDVIALQEVVTTKRFKYMENLSKKTGMKFYESFEVSPCNLIENANFGLAILSKHPINLIKKQLFKNPNLTKQTEKGTYKTHDKGYLAVQVKAENEFCFVCTNLLPFHRFGSDALDHKNIFEEFQDFVLSNNAYALGDFNAILGKERLQLIFDRLNKKYQFLFDEITTTDNKKCDNILLPKDVRIKNKYLVKNTNISDHYLCVAEI